MNETLKRILSGAVYVTLLLFCILYSSRSFFLLFYVFLLIATYEYCNLAKIQKVFPILLSLFSFFILYEITFANSGFFYALRYSKALDLILLFITLVVFIKCIDLLFDNKTSKLSVLSKYIYLIGYIILPFVLIIKIPFGINGYNPKIFISILILIWINDSFAYVVGKSIGKTKLFEKVSPKKTIEGFIGGTVFSIVGSFFIAKYYIEIAEDKRYIWIIIALIVSFFGTIGDLIESKFKRIAEVKDSGKIMPGHGGVLDRLDSVIFVSPIVFLFYQILNYVS